MTHVSAAAIIPGAPSGAAVDTSLAIHQAALLLLPHLERGQCIDAATLRGAMEATFGASDATGAWDWKTAYEACEAATVLFLRKYGKALFRKAGSQTARLSAFTKIAGLLPTHTRRSEESQTFQQFSTPIPLGLVAATAADITPADRVLEPSAGTGLLAILAESAGGSLVLNELADTRADLLSHLFPAHAVTRFDAAQIHDHLDPALIPTVVLMNPPFSVMANVSGRMAEAAYRHVASALARLADGGRLVTITGSNFAPDTPAWRDAFIRLQEHGRVVFTASIDGAVYAKHGTTFATRLTVIDKLPADDPSVFPASQGIAPDVATLIGWIGEHVPARQPVDASVSVPVVAPSAPRTIRGYLARAAATSPIRTIAEPEGVELDYETVDWARAEENRITDAIYEEYGLQSIRIPGSQAHPTKLVQSAAMSSVAPPKPSYRPCLPTNLVADGLLSDAQLETIIYAGEAHADFLAGSWTLDETFDVVSAAAEGARNAVRFRRGFMLGDGTGAGKGRQSAGIILDNWMQGRRKAVWISKSDKLLEDAQRDWSALGMERLLVTPLSRFPQGKDIRLAEGVLFTTYATLRSDERGEKVSRVKQIVDWLGSDFDGVIIFDESHAMQNAAGGKGERGDVAASQQGRAGLRLQHALPNARVVYVSATGATTVHNLAYAQRLGLWGGEDFPFSTRAEFVEAIEAGGVAAMEVLARDLRALGLYTARSLSYDGVEYELVEHQLTPEQTRIYDSYAGAFAVIHNNLDAAMQAANITGGDSGSGTLNRQAKSAARSAFESAKQRFFGHLLTSMKTPTLIRSIDRDLESGHAAVIQIVSTGEALMERRLAELPAEEWADVRVDITPREYVLDYLAHSFPVQLYEPFTDSEGNLSSRPVFRDGQPVESREAVARRDRLIEKLASLPPVPGALDQIVQRFGTDVVAEVTGRSRRIVRRANPGGVDRLAVENRAASANLAETAAFMDDQKRVLIFSDAGGTGRSYHADLNAKNQRLRVHYLLEPGWKADAAIQGLGRTNRTNQAQPPLFRPISTDVKAEKRFLSTIARRLDTLGAITRGQRQTGGQGLFRPEDNLESHYARDALRQLYLLLVRGKVEGCSLQMFEDATGLKLMDETGIKDELPPINTFLNRLLALTIDLQGVLFTAFEQLLNAKIEGAIASGSYDVGLETLRAESFVVTDRQTIHVHPGTGAEARLLTITQRERNRPITLTEAFDQLADPRAKLLINERSSRAAVQIPTTSVMLDDGEIEQRIRLIRPMEAHNVPIKMMDETHWIEADEATFASAWSAEVAEVPEFVDSTIHVVSGLLLPIWKRLPNDSTRVYRLQTDDGERIVGRRVSPAWVAGAMATGTSTLTPDDAFMALMDGKTILDLTEGLQLRRSRVMGANRIELSGFTDVMRDRLRAYGLFHEIISWKLRMFIPTDTSGPAILAKVLERYPVQRIGEREAA
ncbi:strawberry notch family protein [Brucella oryzae]|uniref:strawberry notch family protein n=1 Tax=Brucella oryzae TaxID=335286 RepID=UPI001B811A4B|nr:strawberry notch family protein [Brucella oryzae]MBR7653457.1 strawberry notch family protein [Brucella oryzae]